MNNLFKGGLTAFLIFILFIFNLFYLSVIFCVYLALILDKLLPQDTFPKEHRGILLVIIGSVSFLTYLFIDVLDSLRFVGFMPIFYFTWLILGAYILKSFANIVLFPMIASLSNQFSKKVKNLAVATLIILSLLAVFWQIPLRTIPDDDGFYSFGDSLFNLIDEQADILGLDSSGSFRGVHFSINGFLISGPVQFPLSSIYTFYIYGGYNFGDKILLIVGSGLFLTNYYTETGIKLVESVTFTSEIQNDYNSTPIKYFPLLFRYTKDGVTCGQAKFYSYLFNLTPRNSIKVSHSFTWEVNEIKLNKGPVVNTMDALKFSGKIEFIGMKDGFELNLYEVKNVKFINVNYVVIFDPITFIEFYKYEIVLFWILLTVILELSIPGKIKSLIKKI